MTPAGAEHPILDALAFLRVHFRDCAAVSFREVRAGFGAELFSLTLPADDRQWSDALDRAQQAGGLIFAVPATGPRGFVDSAAIEGAPCVPATRVHVPGAKLSDPPEMPQSERPALPPPASAMPEVPEVPEVPESAVPAVPTAMAIRRALDVLCEPGQLYELRIPKAH